MGTGLEGEIVGCAGVLEGELVFDKSVALLPGRRRKGVVGVNGAHDLFVGLVRDALAGKAIDWEEFQG